MSRLLKGGSELSSSTTRARSSWVTPQDILDHIPVLIGTIDQVVETLQERRTRYGVSCVEVREPDMGLFAPVVARLTSK